MVADRVADQRRREIVQRRHHDAPDLAGAHGTPRVIDDLDDRRLGLHVIALVLRALERHVADLLGAVHVLERDPEGGAARRTHVRRHRLAHRADAAQAR